MLEQSVAVSGIRANFKPGIAVYQFSSTVTKCKPVVTKSDVEH